MKKEKTLTIAQKEKIIEQRVKEHEKDPNRRICFYVKGDGYTRLVRDAWASDMPIHALQKLCVEGLSMPLELGIKIVTGKAMLIGDSRIESYPGGIEMVKDDGRFGDDYPNYKVEKMVERIENYYVTFSNDRLLYVRVLNMLKDNITDEDDRVMVGDDDDAEWLTPREMRDKIKYFDEKIAKYVDELDFLYPLVNKSIKNLPVFKIGTEFNEIERNIFDLVGTNKLQKNQRVKWQKQKLAMTRKIQMELEESKEKREEERHQQDVDAHKHLTTPVADADLKNVSSAWLLPDGRMFGGVGYAFIHDHIRFYLKETGFFKDLKIQVDDEKILEKLGWCKLSMGHGFMMYDRDYSDKRFTEAQHAKIIDWAIARERPFVKINARKIPLKHLMNMTPDDLMDYREWRDSDKNPDLGNPEMILNDDDTEEEMLEYFSPDVQEKMRRNLMVRSVMEKIEKVEDKETEDDDND